MTLKEQLEKYREKRRLELKNLERDGIIFNEGFDDCAYLLLSLVEAHEKNANQDYRGNREQASVRSFQALQELRDKLK